MTRADGPGGRASGAPLAAATGGLTIERLVTVDPPREVRVHPRDRTIAWTAAVTGVRQIVVGSLRGGTPTPITASEKDVSDPQWSPDGRRLAYVRGDDIRIVDADGSRDVLVASHPSGGSLPRWSPDGRQIAFVSRRRGWSQVHVVEAPIPRRGRPARDPKPPEPRAITGDRLRRRGPRLVGRRPRRSRPSRSAHRTSPSRRSISSTSRAATSAGSPAAARSGRAARARCPTAASST